MGYSSKIGVGMFALIQLSLLQAATEISGNIKPTKERPVTLLRGDVSPAHSSNPGITITRPGVYRLTGDMAGLGKNTIDEGGGGGGGDYTPCLITITASDVELDLGGFTLSNAEIGIQVSNTSNVTIKNGSIRGMGTGLAFASSSKCIIENVQISLSDHGIFINGSSKNLFKNCRIHGAVNTGITLISSSKNTFKDCEILDCLAGESDIYGVCSLNSGSENTFDHCSIKGVAGNGVRAYGIALEGEVRSLVNECLVVDISSTGSEVCGISLASTSSDCSLIGNIVKNISTTKNGTSSDAIGIDAQSDTFDSGGNLVSKNYLSGNVCGPINYAADLNETIMPGQPYKEYTSGSAGVNPALVKYETDINKAGFNIWIKSPSSISQAAPVDPEAEQLNNIESIVEVISSDLDACCFTTNNKLDLMAAQLTNMDADLSSIDSALQHLTASEIDRFVSSFEELNDLSADLLSTMTELRDVAENVEESLTNLDEILSNVVNLESDLDAHNEVINSKLDLIDNDVDIIDTKIGQLGTSLSDVFADTAIIEQGVNLLGDSIADVLVDTTEIKAKEDQLAGSIADVLVDTAAIQVKEDELAGSIADVLADVDTLTTNVGVIDGKVDTLTTAVGTIDTEVGIIDGKVDTLTTNVATIDTEVGVIDTKIGQLGTSIADVLADTAVIKVKEDQLAGSIADVLVDTIAIESKVDVIDTEVGALTTAVGTIDTEVGVIDGNVDLLILSNSRIESTLDNLSLDLTPVENDLSIMDSQLDVMESKIDIAAAGAACQATPLTSDDIVEGVIKLLEAGNYCLSEDLIATVSIAGDNVCLCMNNRELSGSLSVYGKNAVVKNGLITDAVVITTGADNAKMINVEVVAASAHALEVQANEVTIDSCILIGGSSNYGVYANGCSNVTISNSVCKGGSSSGDGLYTNGSAIDIVDSSITANTLSSHCVDCVSPAMCVRIQNCRVDGRVTQAGAGDGIYIADSCSNIEIRGCTIFGCGKQAIEDLHNATESSYSSVIYNNFAYDIASDPKYTIRNRGSMGESYGVDLVSGTPGIYSNVYVPYTPPTPPAP